MPETTFAVPSDAAQIVAEHLSKYTYQWTTEIELQEAIWSILQDGFTVDRERALSRRDRPDFIVDVDGVTVAVEVKIAGARNAVLRQIGRYAEHDTVDAIVVASGRRVLAAGMPESIHGKPVLSVHVGGLL